MVLYYPGSETKVLIRLRRCAGWSALLLFTYGINRFSHDVTHIVIPTPHDDAYHAPNPQLLSWRSILLSGHLSVCLIFWCMPCLMNYMLWFWNFIIFYSNALGNIVGLLHWYWWILSHAGIAKDASLWAFVDIPTRDNIYRNNPFVLINFGMRHGCLTQVIQYLGVKILAVVCIRQVAVWYSIK